jgi:hypothetical protein
MRGLSRHAHTNQWGLTPFMEVNPLRTHLTDLAERVDALRGYL